MSLAIAIVSQNQEYLDLIQELLADEGYQTILWTEGKNAYEMICREQPALVLLDLWLEHPNAGEMILRLLQLAPATRGIPVIACTDDVRFFREQADSLRNKHCDILLKPFDLDDLLMKIRAMAGPP